MPDDRLTVTSCTPLVDRGLCRLRSIDDGVAEADRNRAGRANPP